MMHAAAIMSFSMIQEHFDVLLASQKESYAIYKVLKQVHPDTDISSNMNSFGNDESDDDYYELE